ncbi:protein LSM14 homolog B-like [Corythoichthys intestinalis]|uniref:protein LSM14 homolog B-like n=1 Tax=Corythoichthys intestinalis TaxID=161448 RepID=UPI0025A57199|nr:protein LSM14 homolog B-like [Corythoichthys intestinalis]XP_057686385.1 protein LSM14 homolog B-like [Corythoichthys intestinalis]XP_061802974.1 protein LSM14 homolog B-like [Nerophis lumbriciformis]
MSSVKPYIGCKIGLLSRAQNRYEGILYTIDKVNSTVVLAKVKCFGTEGRPTDRPTPPKDDIHEYITFRGSDIRDITLCEAPKHHGLPADPAIVQSSSVGPSSAYPPFSPMQMPPYSQLAASSLLTHQYAAALGLGSILPGLHVRKGFMVEKAVQILSAEEFRELSVTAPQEQDQQWEKRRPLRVRRETRRGTGSSMRSVPVVSNSQESSQQQNGNGPPTRRQGARRRRNRNRGPLMVAKGPSATLKFDTDFDFDYSNAQFNKELEREIQDRLNMKDGNTDIKQSNEAHLNPEDHFGPKCYYDKAKSFFDNISSDNKLRLTWAEERKRNLETFGVPGWFRRGQGSRGGYVGRRGRGPTRRIP